jgi:hypothetical protein
MLGMVSIHAMQDYKSVPTCQDTVLANKLDCPYCLLVTFNRDGLLEVFPDDDGPGTISCGPWQYYDHIH